MLAQSLMTFKRFCLQGSGRAVAWFKGTSQPAGIIFPEGYYQETSLTNRSWWDLN